jgi:hypothetical protein
MASAAILGSQARDLKQPPVDNSTYANVNEMQTKHIKLAVTVDFDNSQVVGYIQHTVNCVSDSQYVVFDVVGIDIQGVTVKMPYEKAFKTVTYEHRTDLNPLLGGALDVTLPYGKWRFG